MANNILSQALYYNNLSYIKRDVRSVVHLEDAEGETFWDTILQRVRPGKYHYLHYSKSENGNKATGCDQCLKFLPYLNSRFFVCIDSDLRYLKEEQDLDAAHYVIQTYTYSWENHYCQENSLQISIAEHAYGFGFNFSVFFENLSHAIYEPLLLLLYCKRVGSDLLTEGSFNRLMKKQCTAVETQNDGNGYVQYIIQTFAQFLSQGVSIGFNLATESAYFASMGLNRDNAYMHVRGHNIYELTNYIGRIYSRPLQLNFQRDVMKKVLVGGRYWEYEKLEDDLKHI